MTGEEFTIDLISSASLDIFPQNTFSSFTNQLSRVIELEGEWVVGLLSIAFPSKIKNVTSTLIRQYTKSQLDLAEVNAEDEASVSGQPYKALGFNDLEDTRLPGGTIAKMKSGFYEQPVEIIAEISRVVSLEKFEVQIDKVTGFAVMEFGRGEGISFEDPQVVSIFGFKPWFDSKHQMYHIGYRSDPKKYLLDGLSNKHFGEYPVDVTCGSQLIFIYLDIIEFQHIGDTRAPILKIIESETRVKNGSISNISALHKQDFSSPIFKKLLRNTLQSVKVELRNEVGNLVPFVGIGKVIITLKFMRVK